jgi:hypothetical protein
MADQDTTAYGATKGLSYVLPWDTMAQYNQMVEAKKEQYEQQNQQKLQTIAAMEQQTQTGMPTYDKALEDHYEKLHLEMGKVIAKYRDPFSSLDGMRDMKTIQAKYLINPIINNAKDTERLYNQLQNDLANNNITKEDYNVQKTAYDRHIAEGDPMKPFQYQRPNYEDPDNIINTVARAYDKNYSETGNTIKTGYTDTQFGSMYDDMFIHKSKDRVLLAIDDYANKHGYGPIADEKTRRQIGIEYLKMMMPEKVDIKQKATSGEEGNLNGAFFRTNYDAKTGQININDVRNHIRLNGDGSAALPRIGFGPTNAMYGYENTGKIKIYDATGRDDDSGMFNARGVVTRQEVVNDYCSKIEKYALTLKDDKGNSMLNNKNIWQGDDSYPKANKGTTETLDANKKFNSILTEDQFTKLGLALGYKTEEIPGIVQRFKESQYANALTKGMIYKSINLDNTSKTGLSANAFLLDFMDKNVSSSDHENWTPDFEESLSALNPTAKRSDYVMLNNIKVDPHIDLIHASKINASANTVAQKLIEANNARFMRTNTIAWDYLGGGGLLAKNDQGQYQGFTDINNWTGAGRKNFAQVLAMPNITNIATNYFNRKEEYIKNVEAKINSSKGNAHYDNLENQKPSLAREFFKGLGLNSILEHWNGKDTNGVSARDRSLALKPKVEEAKKSGKMFEQVLTPAERMIWLLDQDITKLQLGK